MAIYDYKTAMTLGLPPICHRDAGSSTSKQIQTPKCTRSQQGWGMKVGKALASAACSEFGHSGSISLFHLWPLMCTSWHMCP